MVQIASSPQPPQKGQNWKPTPQFRAVAGTDDGLVLLLNGRCRQWLIKLLDGMQDKSQLGTSFLNALREPTDPRVLPAE